MKNKDKDNKIYHGVFDNYTIENIKSLISRGYLDSLESLVKIGKEAEVHLGFKNNEKRAVKIYRINNSTFRKINEYIKRDIRYKFGSKKFNRRTILRWVEKEFRNLTKAHKNNINVPFPYIKQNNIIVMEYIEGDLLKNMKLEEPIKTYNLIKEQIILMIENKIIHCDLSEYNIMINDEIPYLIDFGQAIYYQKDEEFINYKDLFERDLYNIVKYFNKNYNLNLNFEDEYDKIVKNK